jgi:hypothetical protein
MSFPAPMTRAARLRISFIAAATLLLLTLPRGTGWANMAAPPEPETVHTGSSLGEPAGGLRDVFIEHETLRLDLRALAKGEPVPVEAAYRVRNDGPARAVELLFVADGLARGATSVTVDGRTVAATPGAAGALPPGWRPPATTPAFGSAGATLPYRSRREGTLSFRVRLPVGRHEIRVRYPAEATAYSVNELTPVWQLGYVLGPAREWGGFGGMEVRVEAPHGWRVRTEPALKREGDALVGSWNGLPADALSLSAQQPEPAAGPWYLLWGVLTLAGLVGIGRLGWRLGAALGRKGKTGWWALPASAALSAGWTAASAVLYSSVPSLVKWRTGPFAGEYALRAMSYGSTILLLLLVPVMLLVGLVVVQQCAVSARRRAAI